MNRITYVGHATLRLQLDGIELLTDPLLTARVSHLMRRTPVPDMREWRLDALLLSHLHADHLHIPSLRLIDRRTPILAPIGAASFLRKHGFGTVEEMDPGETVTVNGTVIEATEADHPGRPMPGRPRTKAVGYVIHASRHVYFAGDTDLFGGMKALGEHVDVALLPVWGWGPTLGVGHLNPYRAARALEMLRPSLAIPIHWGTYFPAGLRYLMPHLLRRPPTEFAHFAARFAPDVRVCVLNPGDSLELDPGAEPTAGAVTS